MEGVSAVEVTPGRRGGRLTATVELPAYGAGVLAFDGVKRQ